MTLLLRYSKMSQNLHYLSVTSLRLYFKKSFHNVCTLHVKNACVRSEISSLNRFLPLCLMNASVSQNKKTYMYRLLEICKTELEIL